MTYRILVGDVLDRLADLDDASVQTVITSPPYWGLRDYGTAQWDGGDAGCDHIGPPGGGTTATGLMQDGRSDEARNGNAGRVVADRQQQFRVECRKCGARRIDSQLGLEPTPEAYVERMVEVFRHIRQVLRDDGTVWLNLGDSYASSGVGDPDAFAKMGERLHAKGQRWSATGSGGRGRAPSAGLKPKDLVGIPWRVAFALQADGWYLRSDIIWAKPNPMPESVTDRPTKSHEYLFLLTKSARYYFDADAVREPHLPVSLARVEKGLKHRHPDGLGVGIPPVDTERMGERFAHPGGRNIRTVWNIATEPFPGAHFATFPKKLVEPCVKAGTSEKGCCAECGTPWERETISTPYEPEVVPAGERFVDASRGDKTRKLSGPAYNEQARRTTVGWVSGCDHTTEPVPCTVLDPFCGSGTTGLVALRHGRSFVGIELNPTYAEMARNRIHDDGPLFNVEAV